MFETPGETEQSSTLLPQDVINRVLELLDNNERVFRGRLVNRGAREHFSQRQHRSRRSAQLRIQLPFIDQVPDASWQPYLLEALPQALQQAFKQLTLHEKVLALSDAASSGSEVNLDFVWDVVGPCFAFGYNPSRYNGQCAGTAALKAGQAHLLPWLSENDCPSDVREAMAAAAEFCGLGAISETWESLNGDSDDELGDDWDGESELTHSLAAAAGRSRIRPISKLSYLLSLVQVEDDEEETIELRQLLLPPAAAGAAASGNMRVLRWLRRQGLDLRNCPGWLHVCPCKYSAPWAGVLASALGNGHLHVADWLVDRAGCPLPQAQQHPIELQGIWQEAAGGSGASAESVRWLLRRGVPVHKVAIVEAAGAGQLEAVQLLHRECGLALTDRVFRAAARSRSIPTATWLLQADCPMRPEAYDGAASAGDLTMLRWLVQEAKCPMSEDTASSVVFNWKSCNPGFSGKAGLEKAVRMLLAAGAEPPSLGVVAAAGHVPLMRYLHEELGVGFGPWTLLQAANRGCEAAVEWLVGAGCVPDEDNNPYIFAGLEEDVCTLACLRRLGVPWGAGVLRAAVDEGLSPRVVRWMVEQGAPWDGEAVREAAEEARKRLDMGGDDFETAEWLEERTALGPPA